jgi:aspartate/methionine/tyrosine aminotransferase
MFSSRLSSWDLRPNPLALALAARRAAGAPVADLTLSNPTRAGLDYARRELLAPLADARSLVYEPSPRGAAAAREAIARYYLDRGERVDPDRLCLTASTSEGYAWLFKLLADPHDTVLVPRPSYPLLDYLTALESVRARPYDLVYDHPSGWSVDLDSVRRGLGARTRALVVVSPNNPTGSYVRRAEAAALAELCAARDVALIVDEVFADFPLAADATPVPLEAWGAATTFLLNGLSKSAGLPQMKLGWIAVLGPEPAGSRALERLELIADSFLSVGAPVQLAAPSWLAAAQELRRPILDRARANLAALAARVEGSPCRLLRAEGGWSAVLELPRTRSEERWALELLERDGILVHPGYFFDFPREAFVVASLLVPQAELREAAARLVARAGE